MGNNTSTQAREFAASSPAFIMAGLHGPDINRWSPVWQRETQRFNLVTWPLVGSFQLDKLEAVRIVLTKHSSPSKKIAKQLAAFTLWAEQGRIEREQRQLIAQQHLEKKLETLNSERRRLREGCDPKSPSHGNPLQPPIMPVLSEDVVDYAAISPTCYSGPSDTLASPSALLLEPYPALPVPATLVLDLPAPTLSAPVPALPTPTLPVPVAELSAPPSPAPVLELPAPTLSAQAAPALVFLPALNLYPRKKKGRKEHHVSLQVPRLAEETEVVSGMAAVPTSPPLGELALEMVSILKKIQELAQGPPQVPGSHYVPAPLGNTYRRDQCAYCKERGHWKLQCPFLPRNVPPHQYRRGPPAPRYSQPQNQSPGQVPVPRYDSFPPPPGNPDIFPFPLSL